MMITSTIDPAPWFHRMRTEKPVYFDPDISFFFGAKGAWQLFRYQDVQRGLSDHTLFSSEYIPEMPGDQIGKSLAMTDPPRHQQLRAVISKAFVPSVIKPLEEWLYRYCEKHISMLLSAGRMDFVKDFSDRLPATVIVQLLGVPELHHQQIVTWTSALAGDPATIGADAYLHAQREMGELFTTLLDEQRKAPRQGMISHLLQAEIDGKKLNNSDLLAFCIGLLLAGAESTNGLLGNAMLTFTAHPAIQQQLAKYPTTIPAAIQEVLRLYPPVMAMPRLVKADVLLDGNQLREGELVNLWIGAANRDPAIFPDPDIFNMNRDNTRILSFGHGIHYCMGAFLAKMEARIAFETVFRYMKHIRLQPGAVVQRSPSVVVFRFASVPVEFDVE